MSKARKKITIGIEIFGVLLTGPWSLTDLFFMLVVGMANCLRTDGV